MRKYLSPVAFATVVLLTACASPDIAPTRSIEVRGNYRQLADCFYTKRPLSAKYTHLETQKRVEIAYEADGFRFMSVDFIESGPNVTRAETRASMSIFGRDANASGFEPVIRSCATP